MSSTNRSLTALALVGRTVFAGAVLVAARNSHVGTSIPCAQFTEPEHVISSIATFAQSVFAVDVDVDGDGDTDVLYASEGDDTIACYENDGAMLPGFTEHEISSSAVFANGVFAADVDGDGDTDVLSASYGDDTAVPMNTDTLERRAGGLLTRGWAGPH